MGNVKRNNKRLFRKSTVKHKRPKTLKTLDHKSLRRLALAFAIVLAAGAVYIHFLMPHTLEAKQRVQLESTQSQLIQTKHTLEQTESQSKAADDAKLKQIEDLNKQIQEKDQQLQAKANGSKTAYAATVDAPAKIYAVPEDEAKAYIYSHESGNNPAAINSIGCRGLGQACPGSKLPCSDSDYECQDQFFTNYMLSRYGSWNNAKAFWVANHWW